MIKTINNFYFFPETNLLGFSLLFLQTQKTIHHELFGNTRKSKNIFLFRRNKEYILSEKNVENTQKAYFR